MGYVELACQFESDVNFGISEEVKRESDDYLRNLYDVTTGKKHGKKTSATSCLLVNHQQQRELANQIRNHHPTIPSSNHDVLSPHIIIPSHSINNLTSPPSKPHELFHKPHTRIQTPTSQNPPPQRQSHKYAASLLKSRQRSATPYHETQTQRSRELRSGYPIHFEREGERTTATMEKGKLDCDSLVCKLV